MKKFGKNILGKLKNIKINKKQFLIIIVVILILISIIFYLKLQSKKPKLNPYVAPPTPTVTKTTPTVTKDLPPSEIKKITAPTKNTPKKIKHK